MHEAGVCPMQAEVSQLLAELGSLIYHFWKPALCSVLVSMCSEVFKSLLRSKKSIHTISLLTVVYIPIHCYFSFFLFLNTNPCLAIIYNGNISVSISTLLLWGLVALVGFFSCDATIYASITVVFTIKAFVLSKELSSLYFSKVISWKYEVSLSSSHPWSIPLFSDSMLLEIKWLLSGWRS